MTPEIITNAADLKAENIPQDAINVIAEIFFNIYMRSKAQEKQPDKTTA